MGWSLLVALLLAMPEARGQAVAVTTRLETNQIPVGGATVLHVYAQVVPALRATSDRIFAWYVDLGNTNAAAARLDYVGMVKPTSDKDPQLSSLGSDQGANRKGIYDTFLNLPGAGVAAPVELLTIPVVGVAPGVTRFRVTAGSGVPQLSSDFLVAPKDSSVPGFGGDYSAAVADLQVTGSAACSIAVHIELISNGTQLKITFPLCPGHDHFVEKASALANPTVWAAVPGGPHNTGSVVVANSGAGAFFRVRVQ